METAKGGAVEELHDDLRATTEDIAAEADELRDIEAEKAQLDPEDPRLEELARKAERLVSRLGDETAVEKDLADQAQSRRGEERGHN